MCAININELGGKSGINKQHDTNINPEEVLFGSMEENFDEVESEELSRPAHPQPIKPGDINGDGDINQSDVKDLISALTAGDMNHDGKLDKEDYKILKQMLTQRNDSEPIDETKQMIRPDLRGDLNHDGKVDKRDLGVLGKVLRAGDMDSDKKVDWTDVELLIKEIEPPPPTDDPLLEKIKDLSKGLLEDPYHHLSDITALGKALAKYTNTEYDLGKADNLYNFFLRDKSDLTGDGQIDHQDVIKFWQNMDGGSEKKGDIDSNGDVNQKDLKLLTDAVQYGDMNHDGKLDQKDYKLLKDLITPMFREEDNLVLLDEQGPAQLYIPKEVGDVNRDGKVNSADLKLLGKVLKAGDMDSDGKIDQTDLKLLSDQVNPPLPRFISIDLDNDNKIDYAIEDGHIYKNNTGEEVDHIDGVDLKELAKEIKKNIGDPNEVPFPSFNFKFDINHDGKEDLIKSPEYLIQNKGQVDS